MLSIYLLLISAETGLTANLNWDPGLTVKNAAYFDTSSPHYWELCPASGSCRGNLPAGGGFYTLAYNVGGLDTPCCKPNSESTISEGSCSTINGEKCPYYYFWGSDFARVIADKLSFSSAAILYFGLQETLPSGGYGGLPNMNLAAWDIKYLDIQFRTKLCYPSTSTYAHGTFHYYLTLWNTSQNRGAQFRLNLLAFWQTPDGQPPTGNSWYTTRIWNEYEANPTQWVWFLHGQQFGWSPNWTPWIDPTGSSCSSPIENSPWRSWRIDLQAVYNEIINGGYEPRSFFDGAIFAGSIVAGTETWGQSYAAVDVRGYYLSN